MRPILLKVPRCPIYYLLIIFVIYAALLLPTVNRQGISWDEQTDILVARSYLGKPNGWLFGSPIDPSQTRLPAFTVAVFYALFSNTSLMLARYISCLVGALTLVGVYVYAKRRYDIRRGILACALLATSPFFLSFVRVAFTETDIYLACTLIWLLICVDSYQDRPSVRWASLVGVMMGLCISAKFTAIAVLPTVWHAIWQTRKGTKWLALEVWITFIAVSTFLVTPPEHLLNHAIIKSFLDRFHNEMTYRFGSMVEAVGLHIYSIFFKSSLLIGGGLLLSWLIATYQWRNKRSQFPLLVLWFYFSCLVILPLAQTFYTVPLLPILALFLADQFFSFYSRKRAVAVILGILAMLTLCIDLILCYPDYNLNGYQWLGRRIVAGRPSIGYRSVVQTPSDGVEQVIEWLNIHAGPGDRVRTYLLSWHIVQAFAPNPAYKLENGFKTNSLSKPDYIVVEINAQIRQSWWIQSPPGLVFHPVYDPAWLVSNYDKVFTVKRAFGIEMASVYRKK